MRYQHELVGGRVHTIDAYPPDSAAGAPGAAAVTPKARPAVRRALVRVWASYGVLLLAGALAGYLAAQLT